MGKTTTPDQPGFPPRPEDQPEKSKLKKNIETLNQRLGHRLGKK